MEESLVRHGVLVLLSSATLSMVGCASTPPGTFVDLARADQEAIVEEVVQVLCTSYPVGETRFHAPPEAVPTLRDPVVAALRKAGYAVDESDEDRQASGWRSLRTVWFALEPDHTSTVVVVSVDEERWSRLFEGSDPVGEWSRQW